MSTITIDDITQDTGLLTGYAEKRLTPWGASMPGAIPIEFARKMIGWTPLEATVHGTLISDDGVRTINDAGRKMLVHPTTFLPLAVHGAGYTVHPYAETLLDQAALIADGEVGLARVGTLRSGKQAFVQFEMGDNVVAKSKGAEPVEYRPFLNAATSLDGSLATTYFVGTTVIICENTLAAALSESKKDGRSIKVRHTVNSRLQITAARDVLGILFRVADSFTDEVARLTSEYVSDQKWRDFLDAIAPTDKKEGRALSMAETRRAQLTNLWNHDDRVAPWKNSAWGVLAAVNTHSHHIQTVKNASREERNAARIIDGTLAKQDVNTLRILATV